MKVKAIVTGATGMIGEGVVHECLNHPDVESVLVINRRPCNIYHSKLIEIIHPNFFDLKDIEDQLTDYNACFFCLGTTSVGKTPEEYDSITFDITKSFADTLVRLNPEMTFCYISGAGTDSTEKGKVMWARVKGRTENYILNLGFRQAYAFRPGFIVPGKGMQNTLTLYKIFYPLVPVVKILFPKYVNTLKEIGLAMINAGSKGYEKKILEVPDIKQLASR